MKTANATQKPQVLVTGANGFIGKWLVPELVNQGYTVVAAMRNPESRGESYLSAIAPHINRQDDWRSELKLVEFSLGNTQALAEQLPDAERDIGVVYHLAGAFAWGLDRQQAHQVNVEATESLLEWLSGFAELQRFVWIGGYRIAADQQGNEDDLYRTLGAYEASKFIAHRKTRELLECFQIPWTALNPATVIGHSRTGNTSQFIGVAELVKQLHQGKLSAVPGNSRTFVPLVHVDYLAEFAVTMLEYPESVGQEYWLLDPETPRLPRLITAFAAQMGVQAPRYGVPVSILRRLPDFLIPGSKETLSFLSEDEYPTGGAETLATKMQLHSPLSTGTSWRWIDSLVHQRFGDIPPEGNGNEHRNAKQGFRGGIWTQQRDDDDVEELTVLLHGLPLDGESWGPLLNALSNSPSGRVLIADLPGLGRSGLPPALGPDGRLGTDWLDALLAASDGRQIRLIGHSLGAGFALQFAQDFPDRVKELVLVSPYFLQKRPPWLLRHGGLSRFLPYLVSSSAIVSGLHSEGEKHRAVASARASMQRAPVKRNLFRYLAFLSPESHRAGLRNALDQMSVPVTLVVGERDPLVAACPQPVVEIAGAGHNPQLTHPQVLADILKHPAAVEKPLPAA